VEAALSIARIAPCPRVGIGPAPMGLATCVIDKLGFDVSAWLVLAGALVGVGRWWLR
jgi:hypothetical protein